MSVWAVFNGYMGAAPVCALVNAPTEEDARAQAREAFAGEEPGTPKAPSYLEPTEARVLELPMVVELDAAVDLAGGARLLGLDP